ncbi:MAG: hypothetical protein AAB790_00530 [Patescibacteria group bacterium]
MGKRGPKPGFNAKRRINTAWSAELAYAIGLLATDGCLASKSTLIDLTSVDREQLENFNRCVRVDFRITVKKSSTTKKALRIQFRSVLFYNFLLSIGLTPAKSKTIGAIKIPPKYFWDFLRGVYDGDGCSHSYWDPRWRSSYMFYTIFASASRTFIDWLQAEVYKRTGARGHITCGAPRGVLYQLKYAKKDSLPILHAMYYKRRVISLSRKRLKVERILSTVGEKL